MYTPQSAPSGVYEDGRLCVGAVVCDRWLWLPEADLRAEMLALAGAADEIAGDQERKQLAAELREGAVGWIVRPPREVLELERLYRL